MATSTAFLIDTCALFLIGPILQVNRPYLVAIREVLMEVGDF
jgi:hypothetical protein